MTRVCECEEACGCYVEGYAQGKEKAYFEVRNILKANHAARCGCEPCITARAVLAEHDRQEDIV